MRAAVAAAVLMTVLAACGSGNSKSTATTSSSTSTASASSSSTATTTKATGGSTTPVSVPATHPTAHLVAVRAGRQDTVDRVVFEFSDRVPGYKVAYGSKPLTDTSGKQVQLAGSAALVVRMEAASGFNQDTGQTTYSGPKQVQPAGTRAVGALAQIEDFEAVLTWAVGLNAELPFRVSTLTSPPRLVIDIPS